MESELTHTCFLETATSVNQKCCLQLLRRLLHYAIAALTHQQYRVHSVLLEVTSDSDFSHKITLDSFIALQANASNFEPDSAAISTDPLLDLNDIATYQSSNTDDLSDLVNLSDIGHVSAEGKTSASPTKAMFRRKRRSNHKYRDTGDKLKPKTKRYRQTERLSDTENVGDSNILTAAFLEQQDGQLCDPSNNETLFQYSDKQPDETSSGYGYVDSEAKNRKVAGKLSSQNEHGSDRTGSTVSAGVKKHDHFKPLDLETNQSSHADSGDSDISNHDDDDADAGGDDDDDDNHVGAGTLQHKAENIPIVGQPKNRTRPKRDYCLVLSQPQCLMCAEVFPTSADCVEHWRQSHITMCNIVGRFMCAQCPQRFDIRPAHLKNDLFVEAKIARWFGHVVHEHQFPVPTDLVKQFPCQRSGCDFVGLTPSALRMHHQKRCSARGPSWSLTFNEPRCFLCSHDEVFSSKQDLRDHIISSHVQFWDDGTPPGLVCPECGFNRRMIRRYQLAEKKLETALNAHFFENLASYLRHLVTKHYWSIPDCIHSHPCPESECNYVGLARIDLENHSVTHVAKDGPKYPTATCEKCGRVMSHRGLRAHIQICQISVSDRQSVICPNCDSTFSSQWALKYHMRAEHQPDAAKEFLCSYCTFSCRMKTALEDHTFRRHGVNISQRAILQCDKCDYKDIRQYLFRQHVDNVHNDVRAYICPTCSKGFKSSKSLEIHSGVHGEREFPCPFCVYRAKLQQTLSKHIKTRHVGGTTVLPYQCPREECHYATGNKANLRKHKQRCRFRERTAPTAEKSRQAAQRSDRRKRQFNRLGTICDAFPTFNDVVNSGSNSAGSGTALI